MAEAEASLFRAPDAEEDDGGFGRGNIQSYSPIPQFIGDYQVVSRLGGGSMAELYLAKKYSTFGFVRRAVIKQVKRSRPDYKALQKMLVDEARATACFEHPNLVSLLDIGENENGVYLALEFIEGTDLRRVNAKLRQRKEALPFELACYVVAEVLRGLHHAQTAMGPDGQPLDLVHRDVNPSNVLVSVSGHVKLADFGVVRMRERVQQKTEPGLVKGKYAYLAPEYIAGEPCSVQTDIYAAGIMLFELLSGRECFSGATAYEVMWKIVNKGVPMYRLQREGVPEDLQRIVQRATSMVPERRYATAQDMANALEAWLMRSGRHATPWVLSVFFNRHELFPKRQEESPAPAPVQRSVPSAVPKPTLRPEVLAERKQIADQMRTSARAVGDTLTPLPSVEPSALAPGVDVPVLAPDLSQAFTTGRPESRPSRPPEPPRAESWPSPARAPSESNFERSAPPQSRPDWPNARATSQEVTGTNPTPVWNDKPGWLESHRPEPKPERPAPGWANADRTPTPLVDRGDSWPSRPEPGRPDPNRTPSIRPQEATPAPNLSRYADDLLSPHEPTPLLTGADTRRDISPAWENSRDIPSRDIPVVRETLARDADALRSPAATSGFYGEEPPKPTPEPRKKAYTPTPPPPVVRAAEALPPSGKLEDTGAAEVLSWIIQTRESGMVEFRCGLIWKRIFLFEGQPTGISSNMGMELIGEHLVKARILTREALDKALQTSERQGKPLTVTLLEQGSLDQSLLEDELGKNLAARLSEVLEWRWGTYDFQRQKGEPPPILPRLDLAGLLQKAPNPRADDAEDTNGEAAEDADNFNPQKKLKEALKVARSIAKSTGKGRVDRPWRTTK